MGVRGSIFFFSCVANKDKNLHHLKKHKNQNFTSPPEIFSQKRSHTCTLRQEVKKYVLEKDHGFVFQLPHPNQVTPVYYFDN